MSGKIYFFTDRTDHDPFIYKSAKIEPTTDLSILTKYLDSISHTGFDTEFNGSKSYVNDLLLLQLGDPTVTIVADATCGFFPQFAATLNKYPHILYIGHQVKGDYKQAKTNGIYLPNLFDTMVAEQRLHLGIVDWGYGLEDVYQRYLKKMMPSDKRIGIEFVRMNKRSKFLIKHIMYAAADVPDLPQIAKEQVKLLRASGQYEWHKENENGIIDVLGDMEIEGIQLYEDKWLKIIEDYKTDRFETAKKLDDHLRGLGVKIKDRKQAVVTNLGLFGNHVEVKTKNLKHISYSSPKQITKMIGEVLKLPVPLTKNKKGKMVPSVKESAIQQYLIEYPKTPIKKFINDLLYYKECDKFISSYGEKFLHSEIKKEGKIQLGFKNAVTGKVQTLFKQCETDTGRLASGYVDEGYYNCQNLPAKKAIRSCFGLTEQEIKDGWWLTTCDLSQAELIIMAALANDYHLYNLGADKIINGKKVEGDLHSYFAQKGWRATWLKRKQKFIAQYGMETWTTANPEKLNEFFTISDSFDKKYVLLEDMLIDKENNVQLRKDYKRMGFGTIYGMRDNKGAQTLNIPRDEAGVHKISIEEEVPLTIKMVTQAADFALVDGWVEFNCVSHNRRFFKPVLDILQMVNIPNATERYHYVKDKLDYRTASEIEGAARNCRIQGTQADMIKETKKKCKDFALKHKIEMVPLISAHDELAVKHKGREFGNDLPEIMKEVANRYLAPYSSTIKMNAEAQTLTHWIK